MTALDFHPNDDKHFLSGSIDGKVGIQAHMKLHAFVQLLRSLQQPCITWIPLDWLLFAARLGQAATSVDGGLLHLT